MTVTIRLPSKPADGVLPADLLACLREVSDGKRAELMAGESVTINLRVGSVAALMALGVSLNFKSDSAPRSLPLMKEQAVRIARSLISSNEHISIPKTPEVQVDPAGGGFWVDAHIFVSF